MSATLEHRPGDRLLFGPFELRPSERLLLRQGAPVVLGSRAMDILLCLIAREGDVVSADELLASAWRGVSVEPVALRVQMSALRKALGEADPDARYVSSVAGRGYCFVAPISRQAIPGPATPPPEAADRVGLPPPLRRMIGRETVVEELAGTIAIERFVSLVGPGGIGKTTVALALAHHMAAQFAGGVVFADLAILRADYDVAIAVATALHLTGVGGDPVSEVVSDLRSRRLLLVLDSCEHVIQGAAMLAEALYEGAQGVCVLATSREPLNVMGERVHRLAALDTPPVSTQLSLEEVVAFPAVQLFLERVAASGGQVGRGSDDALLVTDICRRLDGIPLAIELAAGRVDAFGLATTLALLDNRLRLSWPGRRTALPRHVTLGATLDWSYDLLALDEAKLLRVLSAFVGAFTLGDAESVAADLKIDTAKALGSLVSKSLVSIDGRRSPARYRLLGATRSYARLKLESAGELSATAARHANWATDDLKKQKVLFESRPMVEWLDYFGDRIQDAQSALDWSLGAEGDRSFAVPLTLAAAPIWNRLGRPEECRQRIEATLKVVEPNGREELALNIALVHAVLNVSPQDMPRGEVAAKRALHLAEAFEDVPAQLRARWCLWNTYMGSSPDIAKAREQARLYRQLAGSVGEEFERTIAERMVGVSELVAGNLAAARAASDRAQALSASWSADQFLAWYDYDPVVLARNTLVSILWLEGMPDSAAALGRANLERTEAIGSVASKAPVLFDACATLAVCLGDLASAERYIAMLDDCVARGAPVGYRIGSRLLRATIAATRGDTSPGQSFLADGFQRECAHPRYLCALTELALRLGEAGADDVARQLADRLLERIEATGERWIWSEVQRVRGELSQDAAAAEALFETALAEAQAQGARAWELRAATSLARRRRGAAEDTLTPLLASFSEGFATRDHVEARAVLSGWGLKV